MKPWTKADAAVTAENAAVEAIKQQLAAANAQVATHTAGHKAASDQLPAFVAEVAKQTKEKTASWCWKQMSRRRRPPMLLLPPSLPRMLQSSRQADRDAFAGMLAKLDAAAVQAQQGIAAKQTMATTLESERNAIATQAAEKAAAAKAVADKLAV